ncbi:MAG: hypothetical protein ABIQ39_02050 [Ilumatobacteraceae bacterium]
MQHLIDVTAANGVPFRFVAEYKAKAFGTGEAWHVTVYDRRYDFTEHGQHTGGNYYAETLLADSADKRGLNVHGGVPDWTIDAATYTTVLGWLGRVVVMAPAN